MIRASYLLSKVKQFYETIKISTYINEAITYFVALERVSLLVDASLLLLLYATLSEIAKKILLTYVNIESKLCTSSYKYQP